MPRKKEGAGSLGEAKEAPMQDLFRAEEDVSEDDWQAEEAREQAVVEAADRAADRIIMEGSDGSVEMTNYLTSQVALRMMGRALQPFSAAILRKQIAERHPVETIPSAGG